MILTTLFLAAIAGGAVGALVATFWKQIVSWFKKAWEKLTEAFKKGFKGVKAFLTKIAGVIKNLAKYYSFNASTKKWQETVVTREVDPSEVPEEFRTELKSSDQIDISDEFTKQLTLAN